MATLPTPDAEAHDFTRVIFVSVRDPQGNSTGVRLSWVPSKMSAKVITNIKAPFLGVKQFIPINITQVW